MNDEQLTRYARHILLDEFGIEGQEALQKAHVLLIGVGGLGCAAAPYLVSAGVGTVTIVDSDTIALSNLQRQLLFYTSDVSRAKAVVAQERLLQINPTVTVNTVPRYADEALLQQLVPSATVVLDCSDNFATRQALNAACMKAGVPLVSGAALRFSGQLSVFDRRHTDSPCYACLFPADHSVREENCALMGVFSPVVAMIGAAQAAEALKIITGIGSSLIGTLMTFNALTMEWGRIQLRRDPSCTVCT